MFHITETATPEVIVDRGLFKMLEAISSFSLCECRGRDQVMLSGANQVLVLDHLDAAVNPASIIKQLLDAPAGIEWLVIVDRRPQIRLLQHFGITPLCHLVLMHGVEPPVTPRPDRTFRFSAVLSAVDFLKQHQLAA